MVSLPAYCSRFANHRSAGINAGLAGSVSASPFSGHATSEKLSHQYRLFDEAELEAEIEALRGKLPDDVEEEDAPVIPHF